MTTPCKGCGVVICADDDVFSYQIATAPRSVIPVEAPCKPCATDECGNGIESDFRVYDLQSMTYPFVVPFSLAVPGAQITLTCNDGFEVTRTVEQGLSEGQWNYMWGQMLDECANQHGGSGDTPTGGTGTQNNIVNLRIVCCDNVTAVVRQVPITAPAHEVAGILFQMYAECALIPGCEGSTVTILVIGTIDEIINFFVGVVRILDDLINALISNNPNDLINVADDLHDTSATLDTLVNDLRNGLDHIFDGITPTPIQVDVVNLLNDLVDLLDTTSRIFDLLGDLIDAIADGTPIGAIIDQLVALVTTLRNEATSLDNDAAIIAGLCTTTLCNLVVTETRELAETVRVLADLIDAYDTTHELTTAFCANDHPALLLAATHATNSAAQLTTDANEWTTRTAAFQVQLTAAISAGVILPSQSTQAQRDIDLIEAWIPCLLSFASAMVGMANVAIAQANGVGMPAALAALGAIATSLETSATGLIANGEASAIAIGGQMNGFAAALRRLALGTETQCATATEFERLALIFLSFELQIVVRLESDVLISTELLLQDVMLPSRVISVICACNSSTIRRTVSGAASNIQMNALYAEMAAECISLCPEPPPGSTFPPSLPGGIGPGGQPIPVHIYGSAPAQCIVSCPDGAQFTYRTRAGAFAGTSQQAADAAANAAVCQLASANRICLTALPQSICADVAFSQTIQAQGLSSSPQNIWSITGTLPTGLSASGSQTQNLIISGTPTAAGTFNFQVSVVTPSGSSIFRNYSVTVAQIIPATSSFFIGVPFSQQMTLSAGPGSETWTVASGSLPDGITMTSGGLISGTPTSTSAFSFTLQAIGL